MAIKNLNTVFNLISSGGIKRPKKGPSLDNFDVFLSPDGNDISGNGTYDNPWKTFLNVPRNCRVGLLPGTYDTLNYGATSYNGASTHGLFKTNDLNNGFINSVYSNNQLDLGHQTDDVDYITAFGTNLVTEISPVEGKGSVILDWDLSINSGTHRDKPFFYGTYVIYNDLIINKNNHTVGISYSVALCRAHSEALMVKNCDVNIGGRWTMNYHNGCSSLSWHIFKEVTFQEVSGTYYATQLYRNYSCTQQFINTTFKHIDGTEFLYPY